MLDRVDICASALCVGKPATSASCKRLSVAPGSLVLGSMRGPSYTTRRRGERTFTGSIDA
jgi:hypothetical protein